jgi:hypothetical protein
MLVTATVLVLHCVFRLTTSPQRIYVITREAQQELIIAARFLPITQRNLAIASTHQLTPRDGSRARDLKG